MVAHSLEGGDDNGGNNVGDGDVITDEDWRRFMEDEHGMKEEEQGNDRFEQLTVHGQMIFTCPSCNNAI